MKSSTAYAGLGLFLVVIGVLFLLSNFGILSPVVDLVWPLLFAAGGVVFLGVFASNQDHWWAIIPGFALLGIAGLMAVEALFPRLADTLGGGMFLGALSLSFWVIYLVRRENWWATIPGGVLLTLAVVAIVAESIPGEFVGGLFFLGLAATFGLVSILRVDGQQMQWALIPAGILGVLGLLTLTASAGLAGILWPLVLIAAGVLLVFRTVLTRGSRQ